jgi:hypothetical protein
LFAASATSANGDATISVRVQDRHAPVAGVAIPSVLHIGPPAVREHAVLGVADDLVCGGVCHTPRFMARAAASLKGESGRTALRGPLHCRG